MATLIVNRPRQYGGGFQVYQILVDGQVAATIANGKTVEIELAPGRHGVIARHGFLSSLPVEIEAGHEGIHHLLVGSNWMHRRPLKFALALMLLPVVAAFLLAFVASVRIADPISAGWVILTFETLLLLLPALVSLIVMMLWRHQLLYLEGIATPYDTTRRVVLPRSQPFRARITIRGSMIAIAALAVLFGAALKSTRSMWKGLLQKRADYHSKLEDDYRRTAQVYDRAKEGLQSTNPNAAFIRQAASKATAMADYHSAMRRKYEEAAARRWITVEPDPPEPPWP